MTSRAWHLPIPLEMGRIGGALCVLTATALSGCATATPTSPVATPAPVVAPAPPDGERPAGPRVIETGIASWYGRPHHGRTTASGERFDMHAMTAAHPTLPLGTRVLVTNVSNNRSVEVRINDRGPVIRDRIIDLSYAAARALGAVADGLFTVRIAVVD